MSNYFYRKTLIYNLSHLLTWVNLLQKFNEYHSAFQIIVNVQDITWSSTTNQNYRVQYSNAVYV